MTPSLKQFVSLLLFMSTPVFADGGSSVGNGGDIISRYLESSREAIKQSVLRLRSSELDQASLCAEQEGRLPSEQVAQCREFLVSNLQALHVLSSSQSTAHFLLRDEPLFVQGPDGQRRQVDARTILGPDGPVEFYYPVVRNFSPVQALTLIAHEFGHKIPYRGSYVEDNPPVGDFASGRAFLDSAANALAHYAAKRGLVGQAFMLMDRFTCVIETGLGAPPLRSSGNSQRLFFDRSSFESFETRVGSFGASSSRDLFGAYRLQSGSV